MGKAMRMERGARQRKEPRVAPVSPWHLGLGSVDNRGRDIATWEGR